MALRKKTKMKYPKIQPDKSNLAVQTMIVLAVLFVSVMFLRVTRLYPIAGDDASNHNWFYYDVTHKSFFQYLAEECKYIWGFFAMKMGRFYPFCRAPAMLISYASKNVHTYRLFLILFTCLVTLTGALLLKRLTDSRFLALAYLCVMPMMFDIAGSYGRNGLYSYDALPQRALLAFLFAAHAMISWNRTHKWYWAAAAALLMFSSCGTYEIAYTYILAGAFFALMLCGDWKEAGRTWIPLPAGGAVAFVLYVINALKRGMAGSTGLSLNLPAIASAFAKQASGGFPLNTSLIRKLQAGALTVDDLAWPILLTAGVLLCLYYGRIALTKKQVLCLAGSGAVLLAGPALVLSLSGKYQDPHWVSWTHAYIPAVVESFGVGLLFLLLLVWLARPVSKKKAVQTGKRVLLGLVGLSMVVGSGWLHGVARANAPEEALAQYELYIRSLKNGSVDGVGNEDKIVSTYSVWGGDTNAEIGFYLRHTDRRLDTQYIGTWKNEGSPMPAGVLYLNGACPGYEGRGAFFLAKAQDSSLMCLDDVTLYVDGEIVPDTASVSYSKAVNGGTESAAVPLSSLQQTQRDEDGGYFAYLGDDGIITGSLALIP